MPSHCTECGKRMHNQIECTRCRHVFCSQVCARRHLKHAHSGNPILWTLTGCLAFIFLGCLGFFGVVLFYQSRNLSDNEQPIQSESSIIKDGQSEKVPSDPPRP